MMVHGPRQIAATGLPASKKVFAIRLHPKRVGIHDAARQEERVELLRLGLVEGDVDRNSPPQFVRFQARTCAGLVERLARLDHFELLKSVLDQDL